MLEDHHLARLATLRERRFERYEGAKQASLDWGKLADEHSGAILQTAFMRDCSARFASIALEAAQDVSAIDAALAALGACGEEAAA